MMISTTAPIAVDNARPEVISSLRAWHQSDSNPFAAFLVSEFDVYEWVGLVGEMTEDM